MRPLLNPSLRITLIVGLTAAGLLMGVALWRSYAGAERLISSVEWVDRNREVLTQLNELLATLESLESLQRAYLLTGQPAYVRAYHATLDSLYADYERLRALQSGAGAAEEVFQLRPMLDERVALLSSVVALYESRGLAAAQAVVGEGTGAELMGRIRRHIGAIEEHERVVLAARLRATEANTRATQRALMGSALASLLLLVLGGLATGRDLRRAAEVEASLRRAKEAADGASQAKTQFLATMSHEVRTPLNAIIGMTDLLRNGVVNSEQAELTRTVYTNAEALLHLINDLLDSSKIEAGQVDLEHVPLSPRDLVEGVAEILAVRAEAKDLELVTAVEPSVPERLLGDPNRLRQVLMNLIGNAIKFTDEGEVSVRASARPLGAAPERVELTLEVADTGIGISPADQQRVFERFVQADASTVRRFGGTGLGLSIARSLIDLMGGRLEIESEEGRGSTFRAVVPLEVPPGASAAGTGALSGLRVLVAMPDGRPRAVLQEMLQAAGASVEGADDGAEARERAGEDAWNVVVVPEGVDGAALAEAAARRGGRRPGLVALVRLNAPHFRRRPPGGLRVEYVFKPVKQGRLLEAVLAAAGRVPATLTDATPADATPGSTSAGARLHRPCVLVVEDNPDNWTLTARALSAAYDVDIAENGAVAVERVRERPYDLVLMDIEMPVMDGFEATRQIRALERAERRGRLPIVALTAHAVEGFRERCLASGMDDYTTKPIKPPRLLEVVQRWVDPRPLVLVADDSPEGTMVVRKFLEPEPVRLLTARNGQEAVEAFRHHRVAMVLLDMDMPVLDGYGAARAIRNLPGGRDVPILALTGYDGQEERQKCLDAGCSGHLAKPLREAALTRAVREALHTPAPRGLRPAPPAPAPALEGPEPGRSEEAASGALAGVRRVRRLLEQRRMAAAADLGRAIEEELAASADPEARRLAGELRKSAEEGVETPAVFWADRLADALRESDRLAALRRTALLDAPTDDTLDRLTRLAARVLDAPVSLVSLVDERRQFFASQHGLGEPWASRRETPLSHSFCKHVVGSVEPLVVADARGHPLVSSNPAITDLGVVAYAGFPVTTGDGHALGSFCVIDHTPRAWTPEELEILEDLAALAASAVRGRPGAGTPVSSVEPPPDRGDGPEDAGFGAFRTRFVETRRDDVRRGAALLDAGAFEELARLGHQLKGSSATLGFPEVGRLGAELEQAARGADAGRVAIVLDLLRERLESGADGGSSAE